MYFVECSLFDALLCPTPSKSHIQLFQYFSSARAGPYRTKSPEDRFDTSNYQRNNGTSVIAVKANKLSFTLPKAIGTAVALAKSHLPSTNHGRYYFSAYYFL
jgi:hypothetical protein